MAVILPKPEGGGKRPKRMRPVRATRAAKREYLGRLQTLTDILRAQTGNLSDLIRSGAERAQVAQQLAALAAQTQAQADALAPAVARVMVTQVDVQQKEALQANIAQAMGVEFAHVVDSPAVAAGLDLAVTRNAGLIKSIASEHWAQVGQAVLDNYRGVALPDGLSLTQRLQQLGGITERRAAFIARDQTAKLVGALNQARMEDNGIEEYTWRTAEDRRVVGTPGGLYPTPSKGHGDHYARNGKIFKWSGPPEDGHPGEAYNCRCYAVPVLDPAKLAAKYV